MTSTPPAEPPEDAPTVEWTAELDAAARKRWEQEPAPPTLATLDHRLERVEEAVGLEPEDGA